VFFSEMLNKMTRRQSNLPFPTAPLRLRMGQSERVNLSDCHHESSSGGLWMNAQSLRLGHFRQGEIQNTVLQRRRRFVRFDFARQIHNAEDLV